MLEIKVGKRYWRRNGTVSGPIRENVKEARRFRFSDGDYRYNPMGWCETSESFDLVREFRKEDDREPSLDTDATETLRDRFAMQALSGMIAVYHAVDGVNPKQMAQDCYEIADAMMAERKKARKNAK